MKTPAADIEPFLKRLRSAGLSCHATDEDVMRVFVPGDGGARELFALAAAERRSGAPSAAERADARGCVCPRDGRGVTRSACPSMIKAIDDTAEAEGRKVAPGRSLPTTGIRSPTRTPRVSRPAARVVVSVLRPGRSDLRALRTSRRRRFWRRRQQMFRQFLDQQGTFVFFITMYAGRRADRERSARERAADLLCRSRSRGRVYVRQAGSADGVPAARHVGAGDPAACSFRCCSPATRRSSRAICICFRRSRCFRFPGRDGVRRPCWRCRRCRRAAAIVGILYAALIFFSEAHLRRALRRDAGIRRCRGFPCRFDLNQVGDAIFRLPLQVRHALASVARRCVVALVVVSGLVLERRVRGVEVVA